jgi:hypothetical protein
MYHSLITLGTIGMTGKLETAPTTVVSFGNQQHHTVCLLRLVTMDEVSGPTLSPGRDSDVYSSLSLHSVIWVFISNTATDYV